MSVDFLELLQGQMENSRSALFPITNSFHLSVPDMFEEYNTVTRSITFSVSSALYISSTQIFWRKSSSFVDFHCSAFTASSLSFSPYASLNFIPKLNFHKDNQPSVALKWPSLLADSSDLLFNDGPLICTPHLVMTETTEWGPLQHLDPYFHDPVFQKYPVVCGSIQLTVSPVSV
jgi:hypothetical protein